MNIIGHQKIINFFNKSLEEGYLNHAYLFSGPEHLGKFSLAYNLAQHMTGRREKVNDDIVIISPDNPGGANSKKKSIKIESIRDLERKISMTSRSRHKVVIIDDAEALNKSAQNALLKVLEEPPENSVIFLIVHDKKKLLPTIVSRCQEKKFSLVSKQEIESIIPDGTQNKDDILFWSLGRPGLAKIFLSDPEKMKKRQEAEMRFHDLCRQNISQKIAMAENLSKDMECLTETIDCWILIAREIIMGKRRRDCMDPVSAVEILDKLQETKESIISTNSNVRLNLENLLIQF